MYNFKTLILGMDNDKMIPIGKHLRENYHDEVYMTSIRMELEDYLSQKQPDIFIVDISTQLSSGEKKNIVEAVEIIKAKCPDCLIMAYGGKKTTLKDKGFQDSIDCFSGKVLPKAAKDYEDLRRKSIVKGNKLIDILTLFFAPYLVGNYEQPGFDRLLSTSHTREENLEVIGQLNNNLMLFGPLLQEENYKLLESALKIYPDRNLTHEEIDRIQQAFFFQFTTLTAMENFIDRRRYYAERMVIENVWESTISFAREIENSIIFGCHKLGDEIHLKITIPTIYDLGKITNRSKFYKVAQIIEPYGKMTIRSGDQVFWLGSIQDEEREGTVDGTVFDIQIRVVVPTRGRRGLKRL